MNIHGNRPGSSSSAGTSAGTGAGTTGGNALRSRTTSSASSQEHALRHLEAKFGAMSDDINVKINDIYALVEQILMPSAHEPESSHSNSPSHAGKEQNRKYSTTSNITTDTALTTERRDRDTEDSSGDPSDPTKPSAPILKGSHIKFPLMSFLILIVIPQSMLLARHPLRSLSIVAVFHFHPRMLLWGHPRMVKRMSQNRSQSPVNCG